MGSLKLSALYSRNGWIYRCLSSLSSSVQLPPINPRPEIKHNKIFINNEFVDSLSGKSFETVNPATEEVICKLPAGQKEDIDLAVTAARTAFRHGNEWRIMTAPQRGLCLSRLANLIERDRVELAVNKYLFAAMKEKATKMETSSFRPLSENYVILISCLPESAIEPFSGTKSLESLDTGKPCRETFFADLQATINIYQYFAGWADKIQGSTVPIDIDHFSYTRREPVGVVGAIIPWNFPLVMQAIKLAPALACGNVVVMKPAEQTSLTALHVAHLIREAGFPAGVVNIVTGLGEEAGAAIAEHMNIDKVAFTGSSEVGRRIQGASARSNLKRTTLELGGKSPMIIFKDADLDYAVEVAHQALFYNQGQVCFAGSRTFVEDSIYDEFVLRCAQRARRRVIGDPFHFQTEHGPQVDKHQFHKILNLIKLGQEEGATLQCGGDRHGDRGYFVQPTVFSNVENAMRIAQEEIFGPVQLIIRFKDVNSLVEQANASMYGLAAGIITNDFNTALKVSHLIDAGTVWINCYHVMCPQLSFGGFKMSGFGRELGNYGLEQYTELKTITMRVPGCNM